MASLIDTNVLVYRVDPRFPLKQRIASELLGERLGGDEELALPHQAIVEFVSAVTRPRQDLDGEPLLTPAEALVEAEELMRQFPVLYPDEMVVSAAFRGAAIYRLSWFDAHLWAYAEVNGLSEILSAPCASPIPSWWPRIAYTSCRRCTNPNKADRRNRRRPDWGHPDLGGVCGKRDK